MPAKEFERVILAALDFLPPGEVSFADYGRAIIAGQRNLIKDADISRATKEARGRAYRIPYRKPSIIVEFRWKRTIPFCRRSLTRIPWMDVDLQDLINSDWIAYQFANRRRELLSIPDDVIFDVLPRFMARKRINYRPAIYQQQLFFKVRWTETEEIGIGSPSLPNKRRIVVGTTLVIDLDQGTADCRTAHRQRPGVAQVAR